MGKRAEFRWQKKKKRGERGKGKSNNMDIPEKRGGRTKALFARHGRSVSRHVRRKKKRRGMRHKRRGIRLFILTFFTS